MSTYLDGQTDWDFLAHLIEQSYRMTAPKRLLGRLTLQDDSGA